MTHVPTYPERNKRNQATFIGPLEIFAIQLLVKYVVLGSKLLSQEYCDPLEKTETVVDTQDNFSRLCLPQCVAFGKEICHFLPHIA